MKIELPLVLCHCLCFFYFREFVTSLILRMWNKTSHNIWKSHLLGRPLSNWTLSEQKTRQVAEGVSAGDGKRWMCHRVPLCRLRNPSQPKDNSWPWTTQVARISRSNQKAPQRIRALLLGEHNRIIQLCWWIPPTWQVHNGSEFFPWHSIMLTECLEAPIAFLPSESVPPWLTTRVPVIFFLQPTIQSFPISAPHPLILCIWQCNQIALMW